MIIYIGSYWSMGLSSTKRISKGVFRDCFDLIELETVTNQNIGQG